MAHTKVTRQVSSSTLDDFSFIVNETPDFVVDWLANWLVELINDGATIQDDETLQFGFVLLHCRVQKRHLSLFGPDFAKMPICWIEDLGPALSIFTSHKYTPESVGLAPDVPGLLQFAVVGQRFSEIPMFADRSAVSNGNPNDSGWFVGSMSEDIDNEDPAKLRCVSLYELALEVPRIVQFLSLPAGCQVLFQNPIPMIVKDGQEVIVPPESYLGQVLAKAAE